MQYTASTLSLFFLAAQATFHSSLCLAFRHFLPLGTGYLPNKLSRYCARSRSYCDSLCPMSQVVNQTLTVRHVFSHLGWCWGCCTMEMCLAASAIKSISATQAYLTVRHLSTNKQYASKLRKACVLRYTSTNLHCPNTI